MKVPLLVEPLIDSNDAVTKSYDGDAIFTNRIIRIICVETGRELYRAANYQMPDFSVSIVKSDKALPFKVSRDAQEQAAFDTLEAAAEYISFMQGHRVFRPYRTMKEYQQEMREAA